MKKAVSVLLTIIMFFSFLPCADFSAQAQNDDAEYAVAEDFEFSIAGNFIRLTSYIGDKANIIVPKTMTYNSKEYEVALWKTFAENSVVKRVYFDDCYLTNNVETKLFQNCSSIEYIEGSFSNASSISSTDYACINCTNLKSYNIDMSKMTNNPKSWGNMFTNCSSLEYISPFPDNIINLDNVIRGCDSLKNIVINSACLESFTDIIAHMKNPLNVYLPANSSSYKYFSSVCSGIKCNIIHVLPITDDGDITNRIVCYGDSITEISSGNYNSTYPMQLYSLYGGKYIVENNGCSGDTTRKIAYRSGTYKMFTNSFTIPESASEGVDIEIRGEVGGSLPTSFPRVTINSVNGRIIRSGSSPDYIYTFYRDFDGEAVDVNDSTVIEIQNDISKLSLKDALIIHAGTNDIQTWQLESEEKINEVISDIQAMIDYAGTKRVVVCGITTADRYNAENSALYEQMMLDAFGIHFVNTREYFLENAYTIINEEPTEEALTEIEIGQVPTYFKMDKLHLNEKGQKVNANCFAQRLEEVTKFVTPTPQSEPTNLRTIARGSGGRTLTLSWDKVEDATGYNVYGYNKPADSWTLMGTVSTNKFIDETVLSGYEYYYRVSAFNIEESNEGPVSEALHTCAACETMDAPSVIASNDKTIQVDWNLVGSHGYVVMWSKDSSFKTGTSYKYITGHSKNSYTISVPSGANQYYVRVRAWRNWDTGYVYGAWSEGVKSGQAVAKVTGLATTARGSGGRTLTLSWNAQSAADSYNVYAYNKPADSWTFLGNVTTNKFIDETVTPGYEYYYRVVAVKDGKESVPSETLHTCAACETMKAPTVQKSGSQIKVGWELVGSHGYVVMWSTDPTFKTGTSYKYITGHSVNNYTITGIKSNQTYYVRVRAWRNWPTGYVYGAWSENAEA